jgi:hypothetical protein
MDKVLEVQHYSASFSWCWKPCLILWNFIWAPIAPSEAIEQTGVTGRLSHWSGVWLRLTWQSAHQGVSKLIEHYLRRNLAEIDNLLLVHTQIHHHYHHNDDLMAFPPEFARVLHREGISAIRARTSCIVILSHSSCKTPLSCSKSSHLLRRTRCFKIP